MEGQVLGRSAGSMEEGQDSDDHLIPGQDQVTHDQGDNDQRCVNAKVYVETQDSSDNNLNKGRNQKSDKFQLRPSAHLNKKSGFSPSM